MEAVTKMTSTKRHPEYLLKYFGTAPVPLCPHVLGKSKKNCVNIESFFFENFAIDKT